MAIYRVHLVQSVSTTVEVDIEPEEDESPEDLLQRAIDEALTNAPSPTNATNRGIDPAGEWEEHSVCDEGGDEVWTRDAKAMD
jgi:hypothetical protein